MTRHEEQRHRVEVAQWVTNSACSGLWAGYTPALRNSTRIAAWYMWTRTRVRYGTTADRGDFATGRLRRIDWLLHELTPQPARE